MNNPFFDLKTTAIQTIGGRDIKNKFALQNAVTGDVFSVVSNRYKPITNLEVNNMFDGVMESMGIKIAQVQNHLDPTGKKWKQWRLLKDFDISVVQKDIVGVMVEIFNGYDGLTGLGFRVLGYRYACTNGMITGKALLMQETFKHLTKDFEKIIASFQEKFGLFEKNTMIWKKWNEIPFSQSEFKELVTNANYMGERLQNKLIEYYPLGIAKYGMQETMWGAFNVITDYLTHYTTARTGSNLFSNAVRQLTKLASDFYKFEATPKVPLLTM